jgi:cardiolipin synthase
VENFSDFSASLSDFRNTLGAWGEAMSKGVRAAVKAIIQERRRGSWWAPFDMEALVHGAGAESQLLVNPDQYRNTLFAMLQAAQQEIALEFYIIEDDEFGAQLLQALREAAARGVVVRMIVDGFGSRSWLQRRADELRQLPLEVRIYHPLPWTLLSLRHALYVGRDFFNHLVSFNRRDHRKLALVDDRVAIIGSHNLWDESLRWHEASLMLEGSSVIMMRESFERVWRRTSDLDGKRLNVFRSRVGAPNRQNQQGREGVLDNTTLRFSRIRSKAILELVATAQTRLWITTPYLWPRRALLRLIKARAEAGVDVKLILPQRSDVPMSHWIAQSLYSDLLHSGVTIHEFATGILHAKVMVADDRFMLGSSNLNHRSFLQDLEIDYLCRDPRLLEALMHWQLTTLAQCEEIKDLGQVKLLRLKRFMVGLLTPLLGYF